MAKHWNYRVVKHEDGTHMVHEVYYSDANIVHMYSTDPAPVLADTLNGLHDVMAMLKEALDKPVLDISELPGHRKC